jgi:hypothetical protein
MDPGLDPGLGGQARQRPPNAPTNRDMTLPEDASTLRLPLRGRITPRVGCDRPTSNLEPVIESGRFGYH